MTMSRGSADHPMLEIADLDVEFRMLRQTVKVLDNVSINIGKGEIVGLVGESGSGKSVTAMSVMGLLPDSARISAGGIRLGDRLISASSARQLRAMRGRDMAMVFQEPMTSLNPVLTVGFQIAEVLMEHRGLRRARAMSWAAELMDQVGIPDAKRRAMDYPHQLSGGMRQRVVIAIAMACQPSLLIADEPTTALDVTIQAQILDLMTSLRDRFGMSILMITHDLGIIAEMAERVYVMYAGQVVEEAPVAHVFERPAHPYTRLLLRSIPSARHKVERLETIEGTAPSPASFPSGCRFRTRCPEATERCKAPQVLAPLAPGHTARCWRATEPNS